ncbi:FeoA family protein [Sphingomonas jatrophae]|uniref:Ferrous iron transport protein A n=1 Tax=Sphingomonas jatrophae TaxID=1166337 RepID=A0A1I6LN58_9SPHN|nr:FeoA family protein [Sphingomonas jatrophae]SFS04863.1 ferrous iron transport protein A [Sphingomonas jatrophae]
MRLDELPRGTPATIDRIDWEQLPAHEARRMRELGFDEGVSVAKLHAAPLGADPIAVRVGRMTIALRRAQAARVSVTTGGAA